MLDHAKEAVPGARYLAPGHNFGSISDKIAGIITGRTPFSWFIGFLIGFSILQLLLVALTYLVFKGTGIWGVNNPVGWGFAIINFVWWIGIGHAGTLISAILMLFRQHWRTSINRAAEAMTVFAVACAAIFPIFHTGRPWLAAYWLFPYPNTMALWPNFRSPLIWDVFAVSTYATVSIVFWYIGLIPDLATMRDRAKSPIAQRLYGIFALGWRGSAIHWQRYETASLMLAGLSTPLVLSVHTVVSFDFAVSVIPGWHATIFPPYFVAGAIYAGFAMVLTLMIPMRAIYGLHDFITVRHIDNMAKVTLATGLIVFYGYCMEAFFGWYSANQFEQFMIMNRMTGPVRGVLLGADHLQRRDPAAALVQEGPHARCCRSLPCAWSSTSACGSSASSSSSPRCTATSCPSSWGMYYPTVWDWSTFIGTMGLFLTLFYLFIRVLPMISIFEIRTLTPAAHAKGDAHHG